MIDPEEEQRLYDRWQQTVRDLNGLHTAGADQHEIWAQEKIVQDAYDEWHAYQFGNKGESNNGQ